jgi:hypothetical protein
MYRGGANAGRVANAVAEVVDLGALEKVMMASLHECCP